eukprot:14108088-Heterocapsa_arctica.AAC.1
MWARWLHYPNARLERLPSRDQIILEYNLMDERMYDKFSHTLLRMLRHALEDCSQQLMESDGYVLVYDLIRNHTLAALGVTVDILFHLTTLRNTRGLCRLEVRSDRLAIRA